MSEAVTLPPSMTGGTFFSESSKLTFLVILLDIFSCLNFFPARAARSVVEVTADEDADSALAALSWMRLLHAPIESVEGRREFMGEGSEEGYGRGSRGNGGRGEGGSRGVGGGDG